MSETPTISEERRPADLSDPATFLRPDLPEVWRRLRNEDPVHLHPATGRGPRFWVITRYADALRVYQDAARFSSARGNMLTSLLGGGDPAGGQLLAVSDPPRHTALRSALLRSFSPRVLRPVVAGVAARADRLVAAAVAGGTCDFAAAVADRLPMATICDLLGVPEADHDRMLHLSKRALSAEHAGQSDTQTREARNEILRYFIEVVEHRRGEKGEDVISALCEAVVDGRPLSTEEIALNCYGLILAGDETGRLAVISAVRDFAAHPEQWAAVRDGAVPVERAVEEILRWNSPAMHVGRTATEEVEIGGRTIPAGSLVTVWNSAANRDETVFDRPETFDLDRTPNKHLAFGHGPHFCLGAYLGRAEITAVLTALRDRVDRVRPAGEPRPLYSTFLRGYSSMPVTLVPRTPARVPPAATGAERL